MKPITLVRIERRGHGVFRPKNRKIQKNRLTQNVYERHCGGGFPLPYKDGINRTKFWENWYFGYKSVEQFQEWIYQDELEYFIKNGFRVYMIEVVEYQLGKKQVGFTLRGVIKKTDITEIFIKESLEVSI